MCIICISPIGERQPTKKELNTMWRRNPDGAGYMFARDGKVYIHKGFMTFAEFYRNVREEKFGEADAVIYHFRIATQGGINPYMCHPFPLTSELEQTRALDVASPIGIAHNGIIPMTSDGDTQYSDTAKFIAGYLHKIIRTSADIRTKAVLDIIGELIHSRMAIMDGSGYIARVGTWQMERGLFFSNGSFRPISYYGKGWATR